MIVHDYAAIAARVRQLNGKRDPKESKEETEDLLRLYGRLKSGGDDDGA